MTTKYDLFKKMKSGTEAIFFQSDSPLYKEMTEAFTKGIIYRDSLDYSRIEDKNKQKYRYTQIHNYAKNTLFPELKEIIEKNTNITILRIVDIKQYTGIFAVDISLKDINSVVLLEGNMTGQNRKPATVTEAMQEIVDLGDTINNTISKFDSNTFGKNKQRKITANLYMDVDMFYLAKDNIPVYLVEEELTGSEMAAIYLHEIGHLFTIIEHAKDVYLTVDRVTSHLEGLKNTSINPKDIKATYTKTIKPLVNKLKSENIASDKLITLSNTTEKLLNYYEEAATGDWFNGSLEFLCSIIFRIFGLLLLFVVRLELTLVFNLFVEPLCAIFDTKQDKTSDVANLLRGKYLLEQMADDFAIRHGAGAALSSGLIKVIKMSNYNAVTSHSLRNSKVFAMYLKTVVGMYQFFRLDSAVMTDLIGSNYEGNTARIRRMAQDTIAVFKKELSPSMAAIYIDQYEDIIKNINEAKKTESPMSDALYKWIIRLPLTLLENGGTINIDKNWEKISNELTELVNNQLYYQSQKFKMLAM